MGGGWRSTFGPVSQGADRKISAIRRLPGSGGGHSPRHDQPATASAERSEPMITKLRSMTVWVGINGKLWIFILWAA